MENITRVDARGLSCPEPVMLAEKALKKAKSGMVAVMVDSGTARDNVTRMARHLGWAVEIADQPEGTVLTLKK